MILKHLIISLIIYDKIQFLIEKRGDVAFFGHRMIMGQDKVQRFRADLMHFHIRLIDRANRKGHVDRSIRKRTGDFVGFYTEHL